MAQNVNVVVVVGNLTKDPELRNIPSGTSVATLRIAVNDRVKRGGEWGDAAYYFSVTVWGRMAENCAQYLSRGSKIAVQGKLTWREYEHNNVKREAVEIVADNVQFLDGRGDREEGPQFVPASARSGDGGEYRSTAGMDADFPPASADDDIPF